MTETIAVLFIFFVLVAFGLIFYFKWHEGAIKEEQTQARASRAMDTTLRVLFLPELMCTRGDAVPEDNCVDMMKVRSLIGQDIPTIPPNPAPILDPSQSYFMRNQQYYYDVFGVAKVVLHNLDNSENIVLYDKSLSPDPTKQIIYEPTYFIVALRDIDDSTHQSKYGFGYLEVGVYGEVIQ